MLKTQFYWESVDSVLHFTQIVTWGEIQVKPMYILGCSYFGYASHATIFTQ